MANSPFKFNLGNRGLFASEVKVIGEFEETLRQKAETNGFTLKKGVVLARSAKFKRVKKVMSKKVESDDSTNVDGLQDLERVY